MKIWFDILTPKQLLFFEPMVNKLRKKYEVICTSRNYREVNQLSQIRDFKLEFYGKHGGEKKSSKLEANINRMKLLSKRIYEYSPDMTISFCSPEAARISYGLEINHIAFCNAPHSTAVLKLTLPLIQKLLTPSHIPKKEFTHYGISENDITQYKSMDEYVIIKNKSFGSSISDIKLGKKPIILLRTFESQASYITKKVDLSEFIRIISSKFPDLNLVILGRYTKEIKNLKSIADNVIVLDKVVDSGAILSKCDIFIGSGGTMTIEAALMGIPTISYSIVPGYWDEEYLVSKKLIVQIKNSTELINEITNLLTKDNQKLKERARKLVASMEDPYHTLLQTITSLRYKK